MQNNNQSFMTKTLRKAVLKRSKLKNKFNLERNAKELVRFQATTKLLFESFERIQTKHVILTTSMLKM